MKKAEIKKNGGMFSFWTSMPLWKQIFIALTLGVVLGVALNQSGYGEYAASIKPIGDLFLNGIRMLIVPLIFVSLVSGVTSLRDMSTMGRLSIKTLSLYLGTTAIAIIIGLALAMIFKPGVGIDLGAAQAVTVAESPSLVATLVALVPANPVAAFAQGNVL